MEGILKGNTQKTLGSSSNSNDYHAIPYKKNKVIEVLVLSQKLFACLRQGFFLVDLGGQRTLSKARPCDTEKLKLQNVKQTAV